MTDEEPGADALTTSVWQEHVRWKRDASARGEYDNSACTARGGDEWSRCDHCRQEVRRVSIEVGRRDAGMDWQEPPFLLDVIE